MSYTEIWAHNSSFVAPHFWVKDEWELSFILNIQSS